MFYVGVIDSDDFDGLGLVLCLRLHCHFGCHVLEVLSHKSKYWWVILSAKYNDFFFVQDKRHCRNDCCSEYTLVSIMAAVSINVL